MKKHERTCQYPGCGTLFLGSKSAKWCAHHKIFLKNARARHSFTHEKGVKYQI